MHNFVNECKSTILKVKGLLDENVEWEQRYASYANKIGINLQKIKDNKTNFHEWSPLYLYSTVSNAKGDLQYSLRYKGQKVAVLKVKDKNVTVSTAKLIAVNKQFQCDIKLENECKWDSINASEFRKHFAIDRKRTGSAKGNEEHRIESLLLTEFTKKSSKSKLILNIQPVKLAGHARFQMPTPLTASKNAVEYAKSGIGGGVDIIARVGSGNSTKLCIMEVKDEYDRSEPPRKAIQQGLAYAKFIQRLLRSENGGKWWQIFGFTAKEVAKPIDIYVVSAMRSSLNNDIDFAGQILDAEDNGGDRFHLHYLYFEEKDNDITSITSSLPQVKCKVDGLNSAD